MTASIEKLTIALLNKQQIYPEVTLWDGSRVTSWVRYNYYYNIYFTFFRNIFNRSEHYSTLLRQHLHKNINYEPENLFQIFLIKEYIKDLYIELWDRSKVLKYKKIEESRDIFYHRFYIIKNELLSLWNNNNFEEKNSKYFIQPVSEDRCLSNIVVGGENVFEDEHVLKIQLYDGKFDWSSGRVTF
jgi:hypothetical protein